MKRDDTNRRLNEIMATISATLPVLDFVGRSNELEFLLACARRTAEGRGSVVLISGDAGIGKSRLVVELRKALDSKSVRFGTGSCLEYMKVPFLPLLEAFRTLAGDGDRRRASGQLQRWLDGAESQAGTIALPVDDQQKYQRFAAALRALSAIAKNTIAVIAIEDIQWADGATMEFLDFLSRGVSDSHILLITTYRRDAQDTIPHVASAVARLRRAGANRLALGPLTSGETRELAFRTLRSSGAVDPLLIDRIYDLSEGNPLYIEELLRGVDEGSFGPIGGSGFVPLTMQAAVQERLNQFVPWEREVLTLAAVVGLRFSPDFVVHLASEPNASVLTVLRKARQSQLLVEDPNDPNLYRFRHALIRETFYEQRPTADRLRLHARIAEELETLPDVSRRIAELAYHWSAAGISYKAVQYNEQAGDAAMRVFAYSDAARFYQQAIGLLSDSGLRRATILEKLAYALSVGGFGEHARIWFERALDEYRELGATDKMVGMLLNISAQCWVNAETETAHHMCARALEVAGFVPNASLQFNARVMLATYCALRGRAREALEHLDKADRLDCVREAGYDSRFFDVRGIALDIIGDTAAAQGAFQRALDIAVETRDRDLITRVCSNFADFTISVGDLKQAEKYWQMALAEATQTEYVWHTAFLALSFAWSQFLLGNFGEARRLCEFGLSRGEESTLVRILAATVGIPLGLILGDDALVQHCADEDAIEYGFRSGEAQHIGGVVAAFAHLYASNGEVEKAKLLLHRGLAALPNADQAEVMLLEVAIQSNRSDVETARRLLQDWSRPTQHLTAQAFLMFFDAQVALRSGKIGVAQANALRAASLFQHIGLSYHCARALEIAARYGEAVEMYRRLGATHDIQRFEGAKPSAKAPLRSAVHLTARELEIARMVASGMTNRTIAGALSISKRTVDHHVNAILARAALRSRVQLAEYLAPKRAPT